MFTLCYGAEDAHTLVLQPDGGSAVVRARVDTLPMAALVASAQRPLPLEVQLGEWDADSGCFLRCTVLCDSSGQVNPPDDAVDTSPVCGYVSS